MKIKNQMTIIGLMIGFSLGLFVGWSTGVSEDVSLEETDITYGENIDSIIAEEYKNIDTFVVNYDWGKEEVYIYEYN